MSKRTQKFPRHFRDFYATPEKAVWPLYAHLDPRITFAEPCAGNGRLIRHLQRRGHKCVFWSDIENRMNKGTKLHDGLVVMDALALDWRDVEEASYIITNPPWQRDLLHPMIDHFRMLRPTWLLIDADWAHTMQAAPYLACCARIVSIGRVSWMENKMSGYDNCAWYLFLDHETDTIFTARNPDLASEYS